MTDKRPYTMTEAAVAQRQAAAQHSTGPKTEAGKAAVSRNAWKTSEHSAANKYWRDQNIFWKSGKPCKSTCAKHPDQNPEHPCTLVLDELTQAGGDCLDKETYLQTFDNLMDAMSTGQAEHVHGIMSVQLTEALTLLTQLRSCISDEGVMLKEPQVNKDGDFIGNKYFPNPIIEQYSKMLKALGLNLGEALATPKAIRTTEQKQDEADTFASIFGELSGRIGKPAKIINGTAKVIANDDE